MEKDATTATRRHRYACRGLIMLIAVEGAMASMIYRKGRTEDAELIDERSQMVIASAFLLLHVYFAITVSWHARVPPLPLLGLDLGLDLFGQRSSEQPVAGCAEAGAEGGDARFTPAQRRLRSSIGATRMVTRMRAKLGKPPPTFASSERVLPAAKAPLGTMSPPRPSSDAPGQHSGGSGGGGRPGLARTATMHGPALQSAKVMAMVERGQNGWVQRGATRRALPLAIELPDEIVGSGGGDAPGPDSSQCAPLAGRNDGGIEVVELNE